MVGNVRNFSASTANMSKQRHTLTTALNGYSCELLDSYKPKNSVTGASTKSLSYHDKISTILNNRDDTDNENSGLTRKEINAKLFKDRRSFYDNYEDDSEKKDDPNLYRFSNNNKVLPMYKSEKHIQIIEDAQPKPLTPVSQTINSERDDFDDLIDLTHRIPKKVFKKINLNTNTALNSTNSEQGNKKSDQKQPTKTSLPPLPFSFVNLNNKQPSHASATSNSFSNKSVENPVHVPKTTTRLIIPLVNNQIDRNEILSSRSQFTSGSQSFTRNQTNLESPSSVSKSNGYSGLQSGSGTFKSSSLSGSLTSSSSSASNFNTRDVSKYRTQLKDTRSEQTRSYMSPKKNSQQKVSRPKKLEPDQSKSLNIDVSQVSQEWDQISKIFDSLETLLNDVVESNRKPDTGTKVSRSIPNTPTTTAKSSTGMKTATSMSFKSQNKSNTTSQLKTMNPKKSESKSLPSTPLKYLNARNLKYKEISDFLLRLGMANYTELLVSNGFDDLNFLNGTLNLQDLLQIGIDNYDDAFKLLKEIKYMPAIIKKMETESFQRVDEWLRFLDLPDYIQNFKNHNLQFLTDLKQLWEIELTTVLQIPHLGHRRRIINALKAFTKHQQTISTTFTNISSQSGASAENEHVTSKYDPQPAENANNSDKEKSNAYNNNLDSLSSSSYSSSSYTTLCNTSTSYKQLPAKIELKTLTPPLKSVKFIETTADKSDPQSLQTEDISSPDEFNSNSSPELSGEISLVQFTDDKPGVKEIKAENSMETCDSGSQLGAMTESPVDVTNQLAHNSYSSYLSTKLEERKSPKPIWKNDPKHLIRNSANFCVQYLGSSALIKSKPNEDPIKKTIDRLKNTSKNTPYQSPKVELAISISGVKLLNTKNKDLLWNHDIKHINNVCQDQDDLNYFAFSTQTEPSAYYYCHVFACKDKELSTQIILTIGQAFDLAYELFCKNNMT